MKRKVREIVHLALMYAIMDRRAYADGIAPPPEEYGDRIHEEWVKYSKKDYEEALEEIEDMQKYHERRYGWRIPL